MHGAIFLPLYVFIGWWLVKHRDKFTFNFTYNKESIKQNCGVYCFKIDWAAVGLERLRCSHIVQY
jgi:hypothetical protein